VWLVTKRKRRGNSSPLFTSFMVTVLDALENLNKVDLKQLTGQALEQKKEEILDLNREQMQHGVLSTGSAIKPDYSPFTINEKMKKGQPFGNVTLKDTGAFQNGMDLKTEGEKYRITSLDSKTPDLMQKYSENIFGLTESGQKEAWVIVKPDVVDKIKAITGWR
jgi:hypothetical protein